MRNNPDLEGKVLFEIERGTEVEVIAESEKEMAIDKMNAKWFKIKWDQKEGWAYGGFIAFAYYVNSGRDIKVWKDFPDNRAINVYYLKNKKFVTFPLEGYSLRGLEFPASFTYVSVNNQTDITGHLYIYQLDNGKKLYDSPHAGFKWEGERLSINQPVEQLVGCGRWTEVIFENGNVALGSKTGIHGSHRDNREIDPRCKGVY